MPISACKHYSTTYFVLEFSMFNEWLWIEMKNINRIICMRYAIDDMQYTMYTVHCTRSNMKMHMLSVAHVLREKQTAIYTTIADADFCFSVETFLFHFSFFIIHNSFETTIPKFFDCSLNLIVLLFRIHCYVWLLKPIQDSFIRWTSNIEHIKYKVNLIKKENNSNLFSYSSNSINQMKYKLRTFQFNWKTPNDVFIKFASYHILCLFVRFLYLFGWSCL